MAKSVSAEKQREFDELKRFYTHWETHLTSCRVFALDHPYNPLNILAGFERDLGISRSLPGLKQAVNDILESCEDYTPDSIAKADASLAGVGAPTLSQLWQRCSRQYKAIVRRGKLRNDTEFYLVSSILEDTASGVSAQEREVLGHIVASYESRRG